MHHDGFLCLPCLQAAGAGLSWNVKQQLRLVWPHFARATKRCAHAVAAAALAASSLALRTYAASVEVHPVLHRSHCLHVIHPLEGAECCSACGGVVAAVGAAPVMVSTKHVQTSGVPTCCATTAYGGACCCRVDSVCAM
jgi:hypothetical protein